MENIHEILIYQTPFSNSTSERDCVAMPLTLQICPPFPQLPQPDGLGTNPGNFFILRISDQDINGIDLSLCGVFRCFFVRKKLKSDHVRKNMCFVRLAVVSWP